MVQSDAYFELKEHISKIRIINTHEHLLQEHERIKEDVDVLTTFFTHYASSDLQSAGIPEEDLLSIWDKSKPLDERWVLFEPWWEKIRNTGYARALEIAARDLYGVNKINSETYQKLSNKMKERNLFFFRVSYSLATNIRKHFFNTFKTKFIVISDDYNSTKNKCWNNFDGV